MKKDFDLLSLGEILLRLSPPNNERIVRGETFQKQVGGAELNVVSGVSLLGLRTGIISKLPDNALGTYAKNRVRFCGVSDDYLVYDEDPDARLGIYYYENGAYPRKPSVVYDRRHASQDGRGNVPPRQPDEQVQHVMSPCFILQNYSGRFAGGYVCFHPLFPHQRHYAGSFRKYQGKCSGDD